MDWLEGWMSVCAHARVQSMCAHARIFLRVFVRKCACTCAQVCRRACERASGASRVSLQLFHRAAEMTACRSFVQTRCVYEDAHSVGVSTPASFYLHEMVCDFLFPFPLYPVSMSPIPALLVSSNPIPGLLVSSNPWYPVSCGVLRLQHVPAAPPIHTGDPQMFF